MSLTTGSRLLGLVVVYGLGLPSRSAAPAAFRDVTERSGIGFVLRNGATPEKHQIETMAGGVAAFDYDGDGFIDLYFANGARGPDLVKEAAYWNRLYHNNGDGTFTDVTQRAGVQGTGYDMGVAVGDYDNDGREDLFVAGVRRNALYHNNGDGTFTDVTERAGVKGGVWSVGGGWFDYDNDGRLDLFVVNYVRWEPSKEPFCGDPQGRYRTYCHPDLYPGLPNALYHNNGDGTFTDVSQRSGIGTLVGKGMAVAFADYDGDGRTDAFVTNDTVPNSLLHNEGGGRFRDVAAEAGVALNDDGRALSSMGVDFRDVDNDGRPDLFVTALANETYPLYRNLGRGLFADATYGSRIGAATLAWSGWGAGVFDFDNDGRKDLFAANGDVQDNTELFSSRRSRLPLAVLWNRGSTFVAEEFGGASLYRGAAFADFDNDGRVDAVVTRLNDRAVLLKNVGGEGRHWLGLKLVGTRSNRDGLGARVRVGSQWNEVTTAVGYASASERRVHFGLGDEPVARVVEVHWPSGQVQTLRDVAADRYLTVREP